MELVKRLVVLSFILLIFSYLTPKEGYRKYYQFFIGVILTVVIFKPIFSMLCDDDFLQKEMQIDKLWNQIDEISYEKKGESILERYNCEVTKEDEGKE